MLFVYSLIFLIGTISAYLYPSVPSYNILAFLILFLAYAWQKNRTSTIMISYLLGLALASYNIFQVKHEQWQLSFLMNKPIVISGYVTSIDPNYVIKVDKINNHLKLKTTFLNVYADNHKLIKLKQNQKIEFHSKLKVKILPINFITSNNFAKFNQKNYLKNINLSEDFTLSESTITTWRQKLWDDFLAYAQDYSNKGLMLAFLFGEKGYVTTEQQQAFLASGTGHLIAISGMHITLVFMLATKVFRFLWLERLYLLRINKDKFALLFSWLITLLYSFLAGFSVPIQRAVVAISAYCICKLSYFKINNFNILGICLFFVVLNEPDSAMSASFWLSFVATFWLLYLSTISSAHQDNKIYYRIKKYFTEHMLTCTKIFIALIPITIFYFNKLSLTYILANVIAIPVIDTLTIPVLLIAFIAVIFNNLMSIGLLDKLLSVFITLCIYCINAILDKLIIFLNLLNSTNQNYSQDLTEIFSQTYFYSSGYDLLLLTLILLLILAPRGLPVILPSGLLSLVLYLNIIFSKNQNSSDLVIDIFDVGQGLSVLINTKNHQLLYDTGPKFMNNYMSDKVVTNSILSHKKQLDGLVISHWDSDHSANIDNIIANLRPKNIKKFYSSSLDHNKNITDKYHLNTIYCNHDYTWQWDGVIFTFLRVADSEEYLKNNSSCVLKVTYNSHAILITGDIEQKTEDYLVKHYIDNLKSEILLVPHHGSKTSSSLEFIKQVSPKYGLISVGQDNIYRLPNNAIIERYNKLGIKLLRTDQDGAIRIKIANDDISFQAAARKAK